jgi:oligosaccharide repeat unit polymerase
MRNIVNYRSEIFDIICYLYVAAVIFNAYNDGVSLSMLSTSSLMENGADLYREHFEREVVYKGFLDHYSHTYEYYAYVVVLIISFNSLCQGRTKFALTMMAFVFINSALKSSLNGTRGSLVAVITLYVGLYSLYYKFFTKSTRKHFLTFAGILGVLGVLYLFAITVSRFDETQMGSSGSVISYLGQSMLYFDYGIADTDHGYYYGMRTFKFAAKMMGLQVPSEFNSDFLIGTHFGTAFTTNIGMLTLDFGYIGTMLFGLLLPWLIKKLYLNKGQLTLPGIYIYVFFYNRMINGAFVNSSGSDYLYWQAFMFYVILWVIVRFISKSKKSTSVKVSG